jgi:hypothetical protein
MRGPLAASAFLIAIGARASVFSGAARRRGRARLAARGSKSAPRRRSQHRTRFLVNVACRLRINLTPIVVAGRGNFWSRAAAPARDEGRQTRVELPDGTS